MLTLKHLFSRSLAADPTRIHLAAHSHHLWPDASFDGHMQAWQDAAALADRKWDKIFTEIWPRAQAHVARELGTLQPESVAFSPNTHDFILRLLSCFAPTQRVRVLTTDSEFHSLSRQLERSSESGRVAVTKVAAEPLATLEVRLLDAIEQSEYDLIFVSHVLFNSGSVSCAPARIVDAVKSTNTLLVFDGYHSFMARPIDFAPIADRAFYLSGGYKYAMSGEGVCFMHAPARFGERPEFTGWFAAFDALSRPQGGVGYPMHAGRFLGSTFDPAGLYRFVHVMDMLQREGVSTAALQLHARALSATFVSSLGADCILRRDQLVVPVDAESRGQFLTFDLPEAAQVQAQLQARNIITDVRGTRLRVSFGLYHDAADAKHAAQSVVAALRD